MQTIRRFRSRLGALTFVAGLLFVSAVPACSSLSSHCSDYCERVHDCLDSSVNTDRCEDACHDWADGNDERRSKVDSCHDCLSDNDTCSDAVRRCTADCAGIPTK
jgi:hypothetical protein